MKIITKTDHCPSSEGIDYLHVAGNLPLEVLQSCQLSTPAILLYGSGLSFPFALKLVETGECFGHFAITEIDGMDRVTHPHRSIKIFMCSAVDQAHALLV
jgi:hypothetical protein